MSLGTSYSPAVPVRVQKPVLNLCLHIVMVTGKCTDVFKGIFGLGRGRAEWGVTREDMSMQELIMGEENFNERGAGFSSIIRKNNEKTNMKSFFY